MAERLSPELLRGSLDLMVLSVLVDGPQYGYLIQQRLRDVSQQLVDVQAGTLYPLLHRLEVDGLVGSRWDATTGRRRKWYELTAAGKSKLQRQSHEWHTYAECLRQFLGPIADAQPHPA